MAENDNSPGARVRDLRRQQGLTQGQLAERAGVSERTIANFEGDATFRMPTALAIARALGVETVWFGAPGRRTGPADYREILLARHVDAFRSVLLLNEFRQDDAPPRDIKAIRADVARLGQLYSAKQMDEIAALGLALLT
ncbi:MAG: helix-turn-helix transcriptional regulator, partial [Myxococcota bacterium]